MPGSAVSSLVLSQFRSHARARLEFDGRPVALIGPNGAGKTNVLEAVSLLSPRRGLRRAGAEELARRPGRLGWRIEARVQGAAAPHEIDTGAEPDSPRQVRIDGKASTQAALGRVLRMVWLVPAMDRLWIEGADGRRRYLDRVTLGFLPDHGEAVLTYERAMRERNRLLRDRVTDAGWYDALEARMGESGALIGANRAQALARLAAAQDGAGSAFPRAGLAIRHPEEPPPGDASDLAVELAAGRTRDMAAGRSLVGPHRADLSATYVAKEMPAALCSTGEQKALLISLILANARALAQDLGVAPVLLLDEVAAHLDGERRAALYSEISALGAQALMTGTEAGLFGGIAAQTFAVVDRNGASHIAEIDP